MTKNFTAAVDMGTNSFHLIIAEIRNDGSFNIVDREREVIRLGSQQGINLNHISEDEIDRAVKILKRFKKLADDYNTDLRAVATSAVREADNKNDFIEIVKRNVGIGIEVIEGSREASLIYNGASNALDLTDKNVLCIDIGGGSTEFIYAEKGTIIFAESIRIGAVRLSKKYFPEYYLTAELLENCSSFIEEKIKENLNIKFDVNFEFAVGSSGTIQAAAGLINLEKGNEYPGNFNGYKFHADDMDLLALQIFSKRSSAERLRIKGLEKKRADIFPAGLLILKKAFELFNIREMIVSGYALREGIILDSLKKSVKKLPIY